MSSVHSKAVLRPKTGRRAVTVAELQATANLTGILEELDRGRVLAVFKAAVAPMGFPRWCRDTVDTFFRYSRKADWQAGWARIVWPSNEELCRHLDLTPDGLKKRIRKLIDLGLVRAIDVGNCRRWGRRCSQTQRILQSCGFDLSPVGERMPEFMAASAEYEARRQEAKVLRAQCSAWSRRVLSMTDHGIEHALEGGDWLAWAIEAKALAVPSKGVSEPRRLVPIEARLKALHYRVADALQAAVELVERVDKEPQGSQTGTPITTTNEKLIAKAIAAAGSRPAQKVDGVDGEVGTSTKSTLAAASLAKDDLLRGFPMSPEVLLHLVPTYRDWVNSPTPNWSDVEKASQVVRQHMRISAHAYGQAQLVMGGRGAAIVVGTIATKYEAKLVHNPTGYLRKMVEQHLKGELRLDKTLHGLADMVGRQGKAKRRPEVASETLDSLLG